MDKPQFVFHGSCKGIKNGLLTPRPNHGDINGKFPDGGRSVVFATHDQDLAAVYTLKTKDMLGTGVENGRKFAVFSNYDTWRKEINSSSCEVYALPTDTFVQTLDKRNGQPSIEWQSRMPVQATHIIKYTPEQVMQTGGQLFFLDPGISKDKWHYDAGHPDHDSFQNRLERKHKAGLLPPDLTPLKIYKALINAGVMTHLNADTGIQPIQLEDSPHIAIIQEDIDWLKQQMLAAAPPQRADGKTWAAASAERTGRCIG